MTDYQLVNEALHARQDYISRLGMMIVASERYQASFGLDMGQRLYPVTKSTKVDGVPIGLILNYRVKGLQRRLQTGGPSRKKPLQSQPQLQPQPRTSQISSRGQSKNITSSSSSSPSEVKKIPPIKKLSRKAIARAPAPTIAPVLSPIPAPIEPIHSQEEPLLVVDKVEPELDEQDAELEAEKLIRKKRAEEAKRQREEHVERDRASRLAPKSQIRQVEPHDISSSSSSSSSSEILDQEPLTQPDNIQEKEDNSRPVDRQTVPKQKSEPLRRTTTSGCDCVPINNISQQKTIEECLDALRLEAMTKETSSTYGYFIGMWLAAGALGFVGTRSLTHHEQDDHHGHPHTSLRPKKTDSEMISEKDHIVTGLRKTLSEIQEALKNVKSPSEKHTTLTDMEKQITDEIDRLTSDDWNVKIAQFQAKLNPLGVKVSQPPTTSTSSPAPPTSPQPPTTSKTILPVLIPKTTSTTTATTTTTTTTDSLFASKSSSSSSSPRFAKPDVGSQNVLTEDDDQNLRSASVRAARLRKSWEQSQKQKTQYFGRYPR
jgi:hypothetical protein